MSFTVLLPFVGHSIFATQLTSAHSYVDVVTGFPGSTDKQDHNGADASAYDFGLPEGTPVLALGTGTVMSASNVVPDDHGDKSSFGASDPYGNFVTIQYDMGNGRVLYATYAHLMQNSGLAVGAQVFAGMRIGNVGVTGFTSGPHLHIQFGLSLTTAKSTFVDPTTHEPPRKANAAGDNDIATFGDPNSFTLNPTFHEDEYTFSSGSSLAAQVHAQAITLTTGSFSASGTVDGSGFLKSTWNTDDYYSFVAPSDGTLSVHLAGVSQELDLRLLDTNGLRLNQGINDGAVAQNMTQSVAAGHTYLIHIDPFQYDTSSYTLNVSFQANTLADVTPPVVSSPSLTAPQGSGTISMGIAAPTDVGGGTLTIVVTVLPSDGRVLLSDGATSVAQGQTLTAAQLTTLLFQPNVGVSNQTSAFQYSVIDAAGNTTIGTVAVIVTAGNSLSGNLVGTNTVAAASTLTIDSQVFLDHDFPGGTLRNSVIQNDGTLIVAAGGQITSDGFTGDTVINKADGTFIVTSSSDFEFFPTFQNSGSLVVSAGNGGVFEITSFLQFTGVAFNNTGTVEVRSGIFNVFQGGASNASTFLVDSGATFLVTGGGTHPAFTFSGGSYIVAGTTEIGDGNRGGQLVFAAGTTVSAGDHWLVNNLLDLSAATITGTFNDLQINTPTGNGDGRIFLGAHDVTINGLQATNGFTVTGTGTATLTGTNIIVNTHTDGGSFTLGFFADGTVDNIGVLKLDHEFLSIGAFNNDGEAVFSGGGVIAGTLNNRADGIIRVETGGSLNGGPINNAGLLILDGSSESIFVQGAVSNTGTIEQSGTVFFEHGFSNLGIISNADSLGGVGIALHSSADVLQGAIGVPGAFEEGRSAFATTSSSPNDSVTNSGVVEASVGFSVDPTDLDDITLINDGIIVGDSGVAVQFGSGNDRLVANPFGSFEGVVDGGAGNNAIELTAAGTVGTLDGVGTDFIHFSVIQVDSGAIWELSGSAPSAPSVVNDGTVIVDNATLAVGLLAANPGQSGTVDVANGGVLELQQEVANDQSVIFTSGPTTLRLDEPTLFGGTIANFSSDDTIELIGVSAVSASVTGSVLTVVEDNGAMLVFNVVDAVQGSSTITNDSSGNSFILGPPPPNTAPTGIALTISSVAENSAAGTLVGTLTGTDPDAGDTLTFSLTDAAAGHFSIDNNNLVVAGPLDFETAPSFDVTVRATDSGGLTFDQTFTITVTNVNEAPTALALNNTSVAENSADGAIVGALTGTDPDAGDHLTFSLTDNAGGHFAIDGDNLVVAGPLDFETTPSLDVTVRATDSDGLTFDKTFTIAITDVNEASPGPNISDMDGNGVNDLVFQSHSTVDTLYASMPGGTLNDNIFPSLSGVDATQVRAAGTGDIDGNGFADVVFQIGDNIVGKAAGDIATTFTPMVFALPDGWTVSGVGDVNGDGAADILISDATNDAGKGDTFFIDVKASLSAGHAVASNLATPGADYVVRGIGDINGDGINDVVFQSTADGDVIYADMAAVADHVAHGNFSLNDTLHQILPASVINASLVVKAVGDLDGDGLADLVVEQESDPNAGPVRSLVLEAHNGANNAFSFQTAGTITDYAAFDVKGIADVNGDGIGDILMQYTQDLPFGGANLHGAVIVVDPAHGATAASIALVNQTLSFGDYMLV